MTAAARNPRVSEPLAVAGRNVLVVGAARSGLAAARLLVRLGARVTVADAKPPNELPVAELEAIGARLVAPCTRLAEVPAEPELAVLSPGVPPHAPIAQDLQAAGVPTVGELELAWQFCPARVVAVTGTNGKGTTCRLCAEMLRAAGVPVELVGNIGRPLAECALDLTDRHVAVVEVSSFQLATTRTFAPHVAALLNIAPDHLDWHGTAEAYAAAKRRIFENQRADDLAVVVIDDPGAAALVPAVRCRLARVSLREPAEVAYDDGRIILSLNGRSSIAAPALAAWPTHFLVDALVAAAAAAAVGASADAIAAAIAAYRHPDHLLQPVATVGGIDFIDDSKATNVLSAVADLCALAARQPVVVITGGKDKGIPLEPWIEALASTAKSVVAIGETAAAIAAGLGSKARRAADLDEAVEMAASLARPGEAVALIPAASSFDMFADYADRGEKFAAAVRRFATKHATDQAPQRGMQQ